MPRLSHAPRVCAQLRAARAAKSAKERCNRWRRQWLALPSALSDLIRSEAAREIEKQGREQRKQRQAKHQCVQSHDGFGAPHASLQGLIRAERTLQKEREEQGETAANEDPEVVLPNAGVQPYAVVVVSYDPQAAVRAPDARCVRVYALVTLALGLTFVRRGRSLRLIVFTASIHQADSFLGLPGRSRAVRSCARWHSCRSGACCGGSLQRSANEPITKPHVLANAERECQVTVDVRAQGPSEEEAGLPAQFERLQMPVSKQRWR